MGSPTSRVAANITSEKRNTQFFPSACINKKSCRDFSFTHRGIINLKLIYNFKTLAGASKL